MHAHMHCVIGTATNRASGPLSLATFKDDVRGTESSLELNIYISLRPWSIDLYSLSLRSNKDVLHMDLMHASWLP